MSNMQDSNRLGVFDSGMGGLSVLREIRKLLPDEHLLYLADTAYCPYGEKKIEDIRRRVQAVAGFLIERGARAIVVACNAASTAGLAQVRQLHPDTPIIGVEPAVKPAREATRNGRVGVLSTRMTLNGARFSGLLGKYGAGIEFITQAAPGLVELVEAGITSGPEARDLLRKYLEPLLARGIDTLLLGCTHYPLLLPLIEEICGPGVRVLDNGPAVARQTARVLGGSAAHPAATPSTGTAVFFTSGDPGAVGPVVRRLWGPAQVQKADL